MVPGVAMTRMLLALVATASLMAGSVPTKWIEGYFSRRNEMHLVVAVLQAMTMILAPQSISDSVLTVTIAFSSWSDFSP